MTAPVIAIVGRPNVGKSTLFNRLCGADDAIVHDRPGVTRDRLYGRCEVHNGSCIVVDTGGIGGDGELQAEVDAQVAQVLAECDAVVFMADARAGLTPVDAEIAGRLRAVDAPVVVAVNKTEGLDADTAVADFHRLGLAAPLALSARDGRGVAEMMARLSDAADFGGGGGGESDGGDAVRVAVLGRPNAGKSTLINALCGEQRLIVSDTPGTTRDCVRVPLAHGGARYELLDTAGVRRRAKVAPGLEKISVVKSIRALEECRVALLVVDAAAGLAEQDLKLAGMMERSGRSVVVVVNKWDAADSHQRDLVQAALERQLRFLPPRETLFVSALRGAGMRRVMPTVARAHCSAMREMPTAELNRILARAVSAHAPPGRRGAARLKFCHQGGKNPPRVIVHGTRVERIPDFYRRYLANTVQSAFRMTGTRVQVVFRAGDAAGSPTGGGA